MKLTGLSMINVVKIAVFDIKTGIFSLTNKYKLDLYPEHTR